MTQEEEEEQSLEAGKSGEAGEKELTADDVERAAESASRTVAAEGQRDIDAIERGLHSAAELGGEEGKREAERLEVSGKETESLVRQTEEELSAAGVRSFSREMSGADRARVLEEVRAARTEYFQSKQDLAQKEKELDGTRAGIEGMAKQIADMKSSLWSYALSYFQIRKLEEGLVQETVKKEALESDYAALHELVENMVRTNTAKSRLDQFYAGQREKKSAYEKELQAKDVGNIMDRYDAVVVHAIHPTFDPTANSLLEKGVPWQTKLKIIFALEPTLSCSTVIPGDGYENMWARMGVVLKKGMVSQASSQDAGTLATGLKSRSGWSESRDIEKEIDQAITQRDKHGYNELVVENPGVGGLYACLDPLPPSLMKFDLVSDKDLQGVAQEMGMPLYGLLKGEVYRTRYNSTTQSLETVGDPLSADDIRNSPTIGEEKRERALNEVFEAAPFKTDSLEIKCVDARADGRKTYLELALAQAAEKPEGAIAEFRGVGRNISLSYERGMLISTTENARTHESSREFISRFDPHGLGYIDIGAGMTLKLASAISGMEAYFSGIASVIAEYKDKAGAAEEKDKHWYQDPLQRLAFHLYGCSEQAAIAGDETARSKALELARSIIPEDEYQATLKKRLTPEGTLKISREDIDKPRE